MKVWYRNLIFIISNLIGLSIIVVLMSKPEVQIAINDPIVQEDYNYLCECALEAAKTNDAKVVEIKNENVKINKILDDKFLCVTAILMQEDIKKCEVEVQYLILFEEEVITEDGFIHLKGRIDYDNKISKVENHVYSLIEYLFLYIFFGVGVGLGIFFIFYWVPKEWKRNFGNKIT